MTRRERTGMVEVIPGLRQGDPTWNTLVVLFYVLVALVGYGVLVQ